MEQDAELPPLVHLRLIVGRPVLPVGWSRLALGNIGSVRLAVLEQVNDGEDMLANVVPLCVVRAGAGGGYTGQVNPLLLPISLLRGNDPSVTFLRDPLRGRNLDPALVSCTHLAPPPVVYYQ